MAADALFQNEHVTVILPPEVILLLSGTLEVANVISERSMRRSTRFGSCKNVSPH